MNSCPRIRGRFCIVIRLSRGAASRLLWKNPSFSLEYPWLERETVRRGEATCSPLTVPSGALADICSEVSRLVELSSLLCEA